MDRLKSYVKAKGFGYAALAVGAAVLLVSGMLLASYLGIVAPVHATPAGPAGVTAGPPSFVGLVEALGPSVVNVRVTKLEKTEFPDMPNMGEGPFGDMFKHFFGDMPRQPHRFKSRGAGSGVIIDGDGTILTNNHVVDGAQEITVTLSDKQEFKARIVGRDPKTDLAVIRIDGKGRFTAAKMGDSDALRVGEWVLAVGNPFGLSNSVTAGIVSAKGRVIGAGPYDDFIQTDAPINPGNSGGPLFNMRGEVVGITTAVMANGQGIGFAIPVNTATTLLPELISKGMVTRGHLGVNIQDITPDLASSLNLKNTKGVLVTDVSQGSPADKAGVKRGDVIVAFDKKEVKSGHELASVVAATPPGKEVPLGVVRDGKELDLKVKVGSLNAAEADAGKPGAAEEGKWGLMLRDLDPQLTSQMGLKADRGVVVAGVRPGSPAEDASVRTGDVILEVNRKPVKGVADAKALLAHPEAAERVVLLVQREGSTFYCVLKG